MVEQKAHPEELIKELEQIARQLRMTAVEMVHRRGSGHPGGSLSSADIVAALFFHHLRLDPTQPDRENRDRFLLSKGHACSILYPALAKLEYFPVAELATWGHIGCHLQGHPDRLKTPGVEMTTGCLGHGINIGAGLCLAGQLKGLDYHTYVLVGDGECQSGILWEGAMLAGKYKLAKLTAIVDYNKVQLDGRTDEIMSLEPMKEKWEAFKWATLEIDGHNMREIVDSLDRAGEIGDRPTVIIAHTLKGKGVSFMEGKAGWHGRTPGDDEFKQAMAELRRNG